MLQVDGEGLQLYVGRRSSELSESPAGLDASLAVGRVISEGIIISKSDPKLPWELVDSLDHGRPEGRADLMHAMFVDSHLVIN